MKKKKITVYYSIMIDGEEFARQYNFKLDEIARVKEDSDAEAIFLKKFQRPEEVSINNIEIL